MKPEDVTVVVPFHTQRETNGYLQRALRSIDQQTLRGVQVIAVRDEERQGAAVTRQTGLMLVDTPWVAFLDSDDEMDPCHLERCMGAAEERGADYVYPWFRVMGGHDPFPMFFGKPFDPTSPNSTTITILVRTELAQDVGFTQDPNVQVSGEDYQFTLGCVARGANIWHHPERTWTWHHHGSNSSGMPGRGDAH